MLCHHYEKQGDLQLALQLGIWVTMTICNFIVIYFIFTSWMLLGKLHELQQIQLIVCGIVYVCNLCNYNVTILQLLLQYHVDIVFHPSIYQWWTLFIFIATVGAMETH
jgi:hypothetical protein